MRVSIDLDLRVGSWYVVRTLQGTESCTVHWQKDMLELCEPKILAFDIECEKAGKEIRIIHSMRFVCDLSILWTRIWSGIVPPSPPLLCLHPHFPLFSSPPTLFFSPPLPIPLFPFMTPPIVLPPPHPTPTLIFSNSFFLPIPLFPSSPSLLSSPPSPQVSQCG